MSRISPGRIVTVAGVVTVVLYLVGVLVFTRSGYPDSNDSAVKIAAYFADHRGTALAQSFVLGMALLAFVCFGGGLVTLIWRTEPARPVATVAAIALAGSSAVMAVGTAIGTVLAYRTPVGDPSLTRTLLDSTYITLNWSGYLLAGFIGAVAVAALVTHAIARWTGFVGVVVAALQILGAVTVARGDGAMSPQGWVAMGCAAATLVWTLCICAAVWRPAEAPKVAPTAPAPV